MKKKPPPTNPAAPNTPAPLQPGPTARKKVDGTTAERAGPIPALADPALQKRLFDALASGATHEIACAHAGVNLRLFYMHLAEGRKGDPAWVEFYNAVRSAEARPAMRSLAGVQKTASPVRTEVDKEGREVQVANSDHDWRAGAWFLERRYPRQYGRLVFETSQPKVIEGMTEHEQTALVLDWVTDALTRAGRGDLADEVRAALEAPDASAIGGG